MRYIARLKYTDKAAFDADMVAKGLINEEGQRSEIVNAIVELGTLYDQSGTVEEPIFTPKNGYHVDIDLSEPIDFGAALTNPITPIHGVKWSEGAMILKPLIDMSYYIGTKSACEAYNEKVGNQLVLNGSLTSTWFDVNRHPAKSLFRVAAHASITPDEGSGLKLVDTLTDDWFPDEQL